MYRILSVCTLSGVLLFFCLPSPSTSGLKPVTSEFSAFESLVSDVPVGEVKTQELSQADLSGNVMTFRAASEDGKLTLDDRNHLVIDRQLRYWIDYYLSALGELDLAEIKRMMEIRINHLPSPGREQALDLLERYLGYKEALAGFDNTAVSSELSGTDEYNESALSDLKMRFDWQKRLRREWMTPETVSAFWYQDEIIDDYVLKKLITAGDYNNDSEKQDAQDKLFETLPEEQQIFRREISKPSILSDQVSELREQGSSEGEIRQVRISTVGEEATKRLEKLDQQRAIWNQRIKEYTDFREELSSHKGLDAVSKQDALDDYAQKHFSSAERVRLRVLTQQ